LSVPGSGTTDSKAALATFDVLVKGTMTVTYTACVGLYSVTGRRLWVRFGSQSAASNAAAVVIGRRQSRDLCTRGHVPCSR